MPIKELSRLPSRMVMMALLVLAIVMPLCVNSCRETDNRPDVVLYVSADEFIARQVMAEFEKETGIRVRFVGDTEAMKTAGLVNRLRAEADNPQADVFWSSEIFMTIQLAEEGVFEEHVSEATRDWPDQFRDGKRHWYGFAARPRVIVYAPQRIVPQDIPKSWMNLTWDTFKGRIVMADPRFGTTGGHLAAMKSYWDGKYQPGIYTAFLLGLAENEIRLLPSGNAGVVRAVVSGEADIGMTDADDVWAAQAQGHRVELIYPLHTSDESEIGNGTLLIPNTVARVRGGPHPEQAHRLIDFLLSEKVERMLAESSSHNIPLRPSLADAYPEYGVNDPLRINYVRVAHLRDQALEEALRFLMNKSVETEADAPGEGSDAP